MTNLLNTLTFDVWYTGAIATLILSVALLSWAYFDEDDELDRGECAAIAFAVPVISLLWPAVLFAAIWYGVIRVTIDFGKIMRTAGHALSRIPFLKKKSQ